MNMKIHNHESHEPNESRAQTVDIDSVMLRVCLYRFELH